MFTEKCHKIVHDDINIIYMYLRSCAFIFMAWFSFNLYLYLCPLKFVCGRLVSHPVKQIVIKLGGCNYVYQPRNVDRVTTGCCALYRLTVMCMQDSRPVHSISLSLHMVKKWNVGNLASNRRVCVFSSEVFRHSKHFRHSFVFL